MRVRDFGLIGSLAELEILAERLLRDGKLVSFDVETSYSSAKPFAKRALDVTHPDQYVAGFSITNDIGWARYVPLRHDNFAGNLDPVEAWETIRPVLETLEVLAHHKKFEDKNLRMLAIKGQAKAPIRTKIGHDTMLAAYTLGRFRSVGLKELSEQILKYEQAHYESLFGDDVLVFHKDGSPPTVSKAKVEKQRFSTLDPSSTQVLNYVCDDVSCALELLPMFQHAFTKEPKNRGDIYKLELLISDLMADVEIYGVDVDWEPMERHRALYKPFASRMEQAVKEGFAQLVKDPQTRENVANLNLGSAPQMQKLLYEDIGWRATRFSRKTGKPSADKIALESLSRKYPAVKRLLQLREMNNLGIRHETWLDEYRDSYDRKVHPNYSQVRVPSGRFAAEKPAIQQLPKHWYWDIRGPQETEDDVRASCTNGDRYWEGWFRKYIIASPNHYLLTYDYSQVELRVLAAVSKEERLLQAFDQDEDVHVTTTAQMLGLPRDEVTDELRQIGKAQPLDAQILTPDGWRKMVDIHVGDFVIGSQGLPVEVTGVFPQGVRKVYEIETSDGAVTQCCGEHLWTVQNRNTKDRKWQTYELQEIVRRGLFNTATVAKGKKYYQPKWMLPARPVVEFAPLPEPLKIDPYVLGALLGDGSFRHDGIMFASADAHLLEAVLNEASRLGCSVSSHFERDGVKGFYIFGNGKRGGNPLKEALKDYGLWRTTSATKFIPEPYLRATPAERLALLQGLMDTDGNVQSSGGEFRVSSEVLAGGVRELARSLGGFASLRTYPAVPNERTDGKYQSKLDVFDCYFTLPAGVNPFQLERKQIKERKYVKPPTIRRVTEVGEKPTQCISVNAEDGLYITDEYIVTHNTLNFAILYGMGVKSLGERMAVTTERAQELYTSYFQQFSSIDDWVSKTRKAGIKNKYVETFFGRRIPLWDLLSDKEGVRKKGERVAINGPVQGGAADYMKYAMVRAKRMLEKEGLWNNGVMITMNQHDSLTFEVRNDIDPNWLRGKLAEAVVFVIPGFPKIVADWEIGVSWGASTKWKDQQAIFDGTTWVVEGAEAVLSASESFGDDYDVEWGEDEDGEWDDVVEIEVDDSGVPTLVVTCAQPPTQARLQEFLTLVRSAPGDKALEFVVAGRCIPLALMTSLSAGDAGRLSLALGGAEVAETVRVRDLEAATAGLSL